MAQHFNPVPCDKIWYSCHIQKPFNFSKDEIEVYSKELGLQTQEYKTFSSKSPGIVFFDEVSDDLLEHIRDAEINSESIVVTVAVRKEKINTKSIWNVIGSGAADVIHWTNAKETIRTALSRIERWLHINSLMSSPDVISEIAGVSPTWKHLLRKTVEIAHFTDSGALITGESGTGKELIARMIHRLDSRKDKKDFVVCDCAMIVPELSGSEFFGHERGAFTGAVSQREGAFELADGGTLFLDEIGELPLTLQAQLLRVIQEKTFKRVGSPIWRKTTFRLICATNRDLLNEVKNGRFRQDLYYRISDWIFKLPSLNDRTEDILPLAQHFMKQFSNGTCPEIDVAVKDFLCNHNYSGNIRELKQLVMRIMHRHVGSGPITVGAIPEDDRRFLAEIYTDTCSNYLEKAVRKALSCGSSLEDIGKCAKDEAVRIALGETEGNIQKAAKLLKVSDRAIQERIKNKKSDSSPATHQIKNISA